MLRKLAFSVVAVFLIVVVCRADQLAYNSLEVSRRAVQAIKPDSVLVSYCSRCDDEPVEVWQVQKAVVTTTDERRYYEVQVFGKRLFRSKKKFDRGQYKEPVEYRKLGLQTQGSRWFLQGIDLAYVYVPAGNGGFRNLARVLDLEAKVRVEKINLPSTVLSEVQQNISTSRAEAARDDDVQSAAADDAPEGDAPEGDATDGDAELKTNKTGEVADAGE
ncbi:MAG TPA: hypothetical protein VF600_16745 [Abditibacteriaceae bacterium]|jgi:hypothetical protein